MKDAFGSLGEKIAAHFEKEPEIRRFKTTTDSFRKVFSELTNLDLTIILIKDLSLNCSKFEKKSFEALETIEESGKLLNPGWNLYLAEIDLKNLET